MSELAEGTSEAVPSRSAGAMLRAARQKQGLHIAALAASIKVTPSKLEALEADRYDELPDLAFTRALARTVCRSLKIDAEPVLALLPQIVESPEGLEHLNLGLNTPFRERPGQHSPRDGALLRWPAFWATALVLLATALVVLWPDRGPAGVGDHSVAASASEPVVAHSGIKPATEQTTPAAPAAPVATETVHSAPQPLGDAQSPSVASSAAGVTGNLVLKTSSESWVEVLDAQGQVLLARLVQPSETVGIDGTLPLRVTVGNVAATQLSFRGRPVDLQTIQRDNVARFDLK